MEVIVHDVLGDCAARFQKARADVQVMYRLAVRDLRGQQAGADIFLALRAGLGPPRKDGKQEYLGVRHFFAQATADGDHTVGDFLGGMIVAVGVVGADHDDGDLG